MKKCLICQKDSGEVIYNFPEYNNKIIKCECGFIYSTIIERENVDKAYLEDYWTTYQTNQGEKQIYERINEFESISDERMSYITKFKKEKKFLDVGCSMGFLVNSANKLGFKSYGIDLNIECVEYGKTKYDPINLESCSLENLLFQPSISSKRLHQNSFSSLLLSFSLEKYLDSKSFGNVSY
jgi:SAM-dependent methyltransferase